MKELKIRYASNNAYEIYYEGGGEVPAALRGLFTDHRTAQRAIDEYLITRNKKAVKDVSSK